MTGDQHTNDDDPTIPLPAGVEDLLGDAALWVEPPPELADRVARGVAAEVTEPISVTGTAGSGRWRSTRPLLIGAAAAVLVLFGAVVVLSAVDGADVDEPLAVELVPTGLLADAGGDIEVRATPSGLRIDLEAVGLPRRDGGAYYEGWVVAESGPWIPIGTFHEGRGVVLWAGVGIDEIDEFTITLEEVGTDRPTDHDSSGDVVLKADLFVDD